MPSGVVFYIIMLVGIGLTMISLNKLKTNKGMVLFYLGLTTIVFSMMQLNNGFNYVNSIVVAVIISVVVSIILTLIFKALEDVKKSEIFKP